MSNNKQTIDDSNNAISSLYKQGSTESPAEHINKAILNKARKQPSNIIYLSFEKIANTISSSKALATAAVFILSISIILQIQFDHPGTISTDDVSQHESLLIDSLPNISNNKQPETLLEDSQPLAESPTESIIQSKPELLSDSISFDKKPSNIQKPEKAESIIPAPSLSKKQSSSYTRERKIESDIQQLSGKQKHESYKSRSKLKPRKKRIEKSQSSAVTSFSEEIDSCVSLSHHSCLSSKICVLKFNNESLICQNTSNHCEENFIQNMDTSELCLNKENCEYIAANCNCEKNGHCQCENNKTPSCQPITSKEQ